MRCCERCGASIEHKRSNARFCDRGCKMAAWHADNRATADGKARERTRNTARYVSEGEHRRNQARAYYAEHREARQQYAREWRAENPHRRREQADRRADRMVGNHGFCPFGAREWIALKRRFDDRCAYCGERSDEPLHQDHVVPLSRGGRHAVANILPACGPCNRAKGDLFLATWKVRSTYPGR